MLLSDLASWFDLLSRSFWGEKKMRRVVLLVLFLSNLNFVLIVMLFISMPIASVFGARGG
jgi:hypothetical protein